MTANPSVRAQPADGEVGLIRALAPAHAEAVPARDTSLAERDRHLRFFGPLPSLIRGTSRCGS